MGFWRTMISKKQDAACFASYYQSPLVTRGVFAEHAYRLLRLFTYALPSRPGEFHPEPLTEFRT